MKLFLDSEFTSLTQDAELISIALVSETSEIFYGEIDDYNKQKCSLFVKETVLPKLLLLKHSLRNPSGVTFCSDCKDHVASYLLRWLGQFSEIEIWSDCLNYDWTLFRNLFVEDLPSNVLYIPFDICTYMKVKGIDPDINRERFIGENKVHKIIDTLTKFFPTASRTSNFRHNALFDALIIKACYNKLSRFDKLKFWR
jgi:hypothetical protein